MRYKLFILPILLFSDCLQMAEPDIITIDSFNFRMNSKVDNTIIDNVLVRNCKSLVFENLVRNCGKTFIFDRYPIKTVLEIQ